MVPIVVEDGVEQLSADYLESFEDGVVDFGLVQGGAVDAGGQYGAALGRGGEGAVPDVDSKRVGGSGQEVAAPDWGLGIIGGRDDDAGLRGEGVLVKQDGWVAVGGSGHCVTWFISGTD